MDRRREQVEHLPRLDASSLAWAGLLDRPWRRGTSPGDVPWPLADVAAGFAVAYDEGRVATQLEPTGTTPRSLAADRVELEVAFDVTASWFVWKDGETVEQRLDLVAVPAHFGGARWWFRCRACGVRRAHLYVGLPGYVWACRACWSHTYRSRVRYGRRRRNGHTLSALIYAHDQLNADIDRRSRAAYRRRLSRARQRSRRDVPAGAVQNAALSCGLMP